MKTASNVEILRNFVPLPIPPFPLRITSIHSCCVSKGRKEGIVQISSEKMDSKQIKSFGSIQCGKCHMHATVDLDLDRDMEEHALTVQHKDLE